MALAGCEVAAIEPPPAVPEFKFPGAKEKDEQDGWQAAAPADGIFDSRRESFVAIIPAAKPAPEGAADAKPKTPRKIEIRTQDAAGNSVTIQIALPE